MSFEILTTSDFKKESKKLIKKYASLKHEIIELISSLEQNPIQGTSL